MKTLSVFDSNEDITHFVQGKIRVSDGDVFCSWDIKIFDHLILGSQAMWEGHCFPDTFQYWHKYTYKCQNQC